jgi:hypothetical protein
MTSRDPQIHVHLAHELPDGLHSPDVYFTPGYGRAASVVHGGEWILLETFDGAWQVPLIVRTLVSGTKDAISPYGYSGVYAAPSLTSAQLQAAWSATVARLQELGVISVLLRHSPLVHQAADLPGLRSIISGHPTIVLESVDEDSAWSEMKGDCRTKIRKARKNGYAGEVRPASREDLTTGGAFRKLYEETMQRLGAAPPFFFGDEYYEKLLDGLGANLLIADVRDKDGTVGSSSLLMRDSERMHGHLEGSSRDDARMGSNNLMVWTATEYAINQGLRQFHLGGGLHARDSLYMFKRSFGGRELEYAVSGLIVDDELYQAQVESHAKESNTTADGLFATKFFPAYRAND